MKKILSKKRLMKSGCLLKKMQENFGYGFLILILFTSGLTSNAQDGIIELAVGEGVYLDAPSPSASDYPWIGIATANWDSSEAPNMGFTADPTGAIRVRVGVRSAFTGIQRIKCYYCWYRLNERGSHIASPVVTKTWAFKCKTNGSIRIMPENLEIEAGSSYTMGCVAEGFSTSSFTWQSDDYSVATVEKLTETTVTSLCKIQAINEGVCNITVSASGVTASCRLTVKKKPVTGIAIDATNFPDENFRNYLLGMNYGKDGIITEEENKNILKIVVSDNNIRSLKGIELFTSLTFLNFSKTQLTSLDLSMNTALTDLYCNENQLTSLDLSKNTALKQLYCLENKLTTLDVSKNTELTTLYCSDNLLTTLDLSKNTVLTTLHCSNNLLTSLDVSKNTSLTDLYCSNNQLTSLDVSKNSALTDLSCSSNQLTSLDVSKNMALKNLSCSSNQLTLLDVSKNTLLTDLVCCQNNIKGQNMDVLTNSLPQNTTSGKYKFYVIDNTNEGNVCTKSQVAAVKAKGWIPMYFSDAGWVEYEGSDDNSNVEKGDLNGDGAVSITDVVLIIDVIAGNITDAAKKSAADVNGDGSVTITDCVAAIDLIAAQQTNVTHIYKAPSMIATTDIISAYMQNGELTIDLDSKNRYTAFQMVISIPEGISLGKVIMNDVRGANHQVMVRKIGERDYLVAGFSLGNEELIGNSGRLLSIVTNGQMTGDLVINNIEFATIEAEASHLASITVSPTITGISEFSNFKPQNSNVFDLQGRHVMSPVKGLYIVNGKKVNLK